ncbi:CRISPR-associated protein Csx16 [Kerstersia gyiorum]|uniref:CRISPR-associated protein Csx16 n=1 Tax=Kerstersia gyiorum TaxID=206506 RepID=UPI003B430506
MRWLVTRHAGALAWAQQSNIAFERHVTHLEPEHLMPGDIVIGSLPVHMAAEVCARGGRYFHLTLHLSQEDRGQELSADTLFCKAAQLEEFLVLRR